MTESIRAELRGAGLRVTEGRVALLSLLDEFPHSDADTIHSALVKSDFATSIQSVHNILGDLTAAGVLRRIERAGTSARFDRRVEDNHHHLVCTTCGDMVDVDCVVGDSPCLHPSDIAGFAVTSADITFWGTCADCQHNRSAILSEFN